MKSKRRVHRHGGSNALLLCLRAQRCSNQVAVEDTQKEGARQKANERCLFCEWPRLNAPPSLLRMQPAYCCVQCGRHLRHSKMRNHLTPHILSIALHGDTNRSFREMADIGPPRRVSFSPRILRIARYRWRHHARNSLFCSRLVSGFLWGSELTSCRRLLRT